MITFVHLYAWLCARNSQLQSLNTLFMPFWRILELINTYICTYFPFMRVYAPLLLSLCAFIRTRKSENTNWRAKGAPGRDLVKPVPISIFAQYGRLWKAGHSITGSEPLDRPHIPLQRHGMLTSQPCRHISQRPYVARWSVHDRIHRRQNGSYTRTRVHHIAALPHGHDARKIRGRKRLGLNSDEYSRPYS